MMIDNRLHDNNGDTATSYHLRHFSRFSGFPRYHNTNIDKVCQFLDDPTFQSFLDMQEQDRAYSIDYAHGLELDDEFGDPYGIPRNGLDDTAYRFILKCHILAIKCNGTLPELVHFISSVLGCSDNDVTLGLARHYVKGRLTGEPDAILIRNINIDNVENDQLVPLLANQLQLAVPANKRVLDVNFDTTADANAYVGLVPVTGACMELSFPATVDNSNTISITDHIGVEPAAGLLMPISFPKNITDYESLPISTTYAGTGLNIHAHATIPMPLSNEQVNVNVPITNGIQFVGYGYAEI